MTKYLRYLLVGLAILFSFSLMLALMDVPLPPAIVSPLLGGLIYLGIVVAILSLGYLITYHVKSWIFENNLTHFLLFGIAGSLIEGLGFGKRFGYWWLWLFPFILWGLVFNYSKVIADRDYRWKRLLGPTLVLAIYFGFHLIMLLSYDPWLHR